MNINIKQFQLPDLNNNNVMQTYNALEDQGSIREIIDSFDTDPNFPNDPNPPADKIRSLLTCLSQVRNSKGRLKGECESRIKVALYENCYANKIETLMVVGQAQYKNDPTLQQTTKKLAYFASSYFKKVGFQLKKAYGNNMRSGVSYATTGSMLLLGGLANAFSISSNDYSTIYKVVVWTSVATGVMMIGFPVVNSFYLARRIDEQEYLE